MRAPIPLLVTCFALEAGAADPCPSNSLGSPDNAEEVQVCEGGDIEMTHACHCAVYTKEERPWGPTADLTLTVPPDLKVVTGEWTDIPFTLSYRGKAPAEFDFPGGSVIYEKEIRNAKGPVERPPCAVMAMLPDPVRLKLRPGGLVRSKLSWKASNYQYEGCHDMAQNLPPGRYNVTFATVSGAPPLTVTIAITVTPKKRR